MEQPKIEGLIKMAYQGWKTAQPSSEHPDDETLACFLENKIDKETEAKVKMHLLQCRGCAELVVAQLSSLSSEGEEPSKTLIEQTRASLHQELGQRILEVIIRMKDSFLELISATGDVLVGQEVIPATVLRSRHINEFKDEVIIFKDFKDVRIEMRIAHKTQGVFEVIIIAKNKVDLSVEKNLRVTLIRDGRELESYQNDTGKVCFEHLLVGKYSVEISTIHELKASILVDIGS